MTGRRSVDFRRARAKRGYGRLKRELLEELIQLELSLDHWIIRTAAMEGNVEQESVRKRLECERAVETVVSKLREITFWVGVVDGN